MKAAKSAAVGIFSLLFSASLFAVLLAPCAASAAPSAGTSKTVEAAKEAAKSRKKFSRFFATLTDSQKQRVIASLRSARVGTYDDSDSDGVPDLAESPNGTDVCESDSNHDGHLDGAERHREGKVTAVDGSSVTVGGLQFTIDGSTVFDGLAQGDLAVGSCVDVEGYLNGSGITVASKVEAKDDCSGGHHSSSSSSSGQSSSSSSSEDH